VIYCEYSDTQKIDNNNNNNDEISGIDNISSDINDNEEEESAEDNVENEEDNNSNNNEVTNTIREYIHGVFQMDVGLEITFQSRCVCYTCNYAYSAIPRVRKILSKLLRIEIETNHIIMTMGMYQIEPPWVSICLIHTY
jgi:hypothetical protein